MQENQRSAEGRVTIEPSSPSRVTQDLGAIASVHSVNVVGAGRITMERATVSYDGSALQFHLSDGQGWSWPGYYVRRVLVDNQLFWKSDPRDAGWQATREWSAEDRLWCLRRAMDAMSSDERFHKTPHHTNLLFTELARKLTDYEPWQLENMRSAIHQYTPPTRFNPAA